MRSLELVASGEPALVDAAAPPGRPAPGTVRIRMRAAGICGTDAAIASGRRTPPSFPWRLGHEGVGDVIELGDGVTGLAVGTRVALEPNVTCGVCVWCRAGRSSACLTRASAGVLTQPGFFAEVVDHPSDFCHVVDPELPLARVVCAEPLAVATAAVRRANVTADDTVLVLGAGAQGLLAVLVLRAMGVTPFVLEPRRDRRERAVALGALDADHAEPGAITRVVDAAGVPAAVRAAFPQLAPTAEVTIIGESNDDLGLSTLHLVQRQLTVRGSFIYDHPADMAAAVSNLASLATDEILAEPSGWKDLPDLVRNFGVQDRKPWVIFED